MRSKALWLGTGAAAMLLAGIGGTAQARPRGFGGGWGHHHRGGGDGDLFGALVAGVLIGGVIAAVSKSGESNRTAPPPSPEEERAVDRCEAQVTADGARVIGIDGVDRFADGWRVRGGAERAGGAGPFTCSIIGERIDGVRYGGAAGQ